MTFDPLSLENLGDSIARAISDSVGASLDALPTFRGAGIYSLYYSGPHPAYEALVASNETAEQPHPIYVGQAAPGGSRKGDQDAAVGSRLRGRLAQHAKSIESAENLELRDFRARWLVLDNVWLTLGESALIARHSPVWNSLLDGFGNHAPGKGRSAMVRPLWDTLHPGREWAARLTPAALTPERIESDVREFLRARLQ